MKNLNLFLLCAAACLFVTACEDEEPQVPGNEEDVREVTINASISCSDSAFTANEDGGEVVFPAGGGQVVVDVDCDAEWTVSGGDEAWLEVVADGDEGSLTLTASGNEEYDALSVTLTLLISETGEEFAIITVSEDAKAYITLETTEVSFECGASSSTISYESNYDAECSVEDSADWLSVDCSDGTLNVTVTENNESGDRECVVTVTAGDGADNVAEVQFTVSQEYNVLRDLILVYSVTAGTEIVLPLNGTVDCTVDWGDGNTEEVSDVLPAHTYETDGDYEVTVRGTVTALTADMSSSSAKPYLTKVKQWGKTGLTSLADAFYECTALTTVPADTEGSFEDVTTFEDMFFYCTALESVPEGLFAYASKATTFSGTFHACKALTEIPEDVFSYSPEAETFDYVLFSCQALTELPENLFANCPKATTFEDAFCNDKGLTEIPAGLFANNTLVTNFTSVFDNCYGSKFTTIPSGLFANCTEVTTFECAFEECSSLTTIPTDLFANCLKVTSFEMTFYEDEELSGESPYNLIDGEKVHLYERLDHQDYFGVTSIESDNCFYKCKQLDDYSDIPSDWR